MEEDIKILENTSIMKLKDGLSYDESIEYKFAIDNILNELERLQKENEDWQKAFKEEKDEQFNILTKKCSHCGENTPLYCEKCYQELISKNGELQLKYEVFIETNYIPKTVIRDKIQLLEKELNLLDIRDKLTLIENDYIISVLEELLGE